MAEGSTCLSASSSPRTSSASFSPAPVNSATLYAKTADAKAGIVTGAVPVKAAVVAVEAKTAAIKFGAVLKNPSAIPFPRVLGKLSGFLTSFTNRCIKASSAFNFFKNGSLLFLYLLKTVFFTMS